MDGLNYCVGQLQATNQVSTKMASNEVSTTNVEVSLQVTMKDPKKIAVGKRLAEWNCNNKEKLDQAAKTQESKPMLT